MCYMARTLGLKKSLLKSYLNMSTPWSEKWQPTPVFLPRESHGQRSLAGYRVAKSQAQLKQLNAHISTDGGNSNSGSGKQEVGQCFLSICVNLK